MFTGKTLAHFCHIHSLPQLQFTIVALLTSLVAIDQYRSYLHIRLLQVDFAIVNTLLLVYNLIGELLLTALQSRDLYGEGVVALAQGLHLTVR